MFKEDKVDHFVKDIISKADIPGLSIVIIQGDQTFYKRNYSYAKKLLKQAVNEHMLFELGSTTKAFTALGFLKLEDEGKVNQNDPVSKHLQWFFMRY